MQVLDGKNKSQDLPCIHLNSSDLIYSFTFVVISRDLKLGEVGKLCSVIPRLLLTHPSLFHPLPGPHNTFLALDTINNASPTVYLKVLQQLLHCPQGNP